MVSRQVRILRIREAGSAKRLKFQYWKKKLDSNYYTAELKYFLEQKGL